MSQQQRFILAFVLSIAILFGFSYLQRKLYPPPETANVNANTAASPQTSATPAPANNQTQNQPQNTAPPTAINSNAPQREITIKSPLYQVKLDTKGAVATSWILLKNSATEHPLYSVAGPKSAQIPLELVSQEGLKNRSPRELPLALATGDTNFNNALASATFAVSGADSDIIDLSGGAKKLDFTLKDAASGVEIVKSLTFHSNSYLVDAEVKATRGGQAMPVKLLLGPSIGDQGIPAYTFYSVAPEAVAYANGAVERHLAQAISEKNGNNLAIQDNANAAWAGVADTYFAMLAIPAAATSGIEYKVSHLYQHEHNGTKETRYLLTAHVPVGEGKPAKLFVGPKDISVLEQTDKDLGGALALEKVVDYGFGETMSRPISKPILWAINKLNNLTGSYGIAIIIFTIIIYSLFFPLKWRSSKAMKKAQEYQPRMKELQEKMKKMKPDDPRMKQLQIEQMQLFKESNMLGGCLPLLLQMPFLFALYRAITVSLDFRQASFLWIPDLSTAEPYAIHILPLLFAASMFLIQILTPNPSGDKMQRNMMAVMMPAMMLFMMWSAPAGLLVYWLVGNIVGVIQQFIINRALHIDPNAAVAPQTT
jgi:YidC/Oxa1 family membrane protein insertase